MARPQQRAAYDEGADLPALGAAHTAGIVQNHPFIDGNKRTGFVVGVLFLELHGLRVEADQDDAARAVIALASSEWDENAYAAFLRSQSA